MATVVSLSAGPGEWTPHGKRLIAQSMYMKGKAFIGAALLLRRRDGYEYVVLHLLCQGIEVLGKGYLLLVNYDAHKPKLRKYGHNLVKLVAAVETAMHEPILKAVVRTELEVLSSLYSQHLLRYGSGYDVLVNPNTIPSGRVLSRVAALLRVVERKGIDHEQAI